MESELLVVVSEGYLSPEYPVTWTVYRNPTTVSVPLTPSITDLSLGYSYYVSLVSRQPGVHDLDSTGTGV
jgi:hypothetical protein